MTSRVQPIIVFDVNENVGNRAGERVGSRRVGRLKEEVLSGRQNGHIIFTVIPV